MVPGACVVSVWEKEHKNTMQWPTSTCQWMVTEGVNKGLFILIRACDVCILIGKPCTNGLWSIFVRQTGGIPYSNTQPTMMFGPWYTAPGRSDSKTPGSQLWLQDAQRWCATGQPSSTCSLTWTAGVVQQPGPNKPLFSVGRVYIMLHAVSCAYKKKLSRSQMHQTQETAHLIYTNQLENVLILYKSIMWLLLLALLNPQTTQISQLCRQRLKLFKLTVQSFETLHSPAQ